MLHSYVISKRGGQRERGLRGTRSGRREELLVMDGWLAVSLGSLLLLLGKSRSCRSRCLYLLDGGGTAAGVLSEEVPLVS